MASTSQLLPASSPTAPVTSPQPPLADLQLHRHAPNSTTLLTPSSSLPFLDSRQDLLRSASPVKPLPRDAGGRACFSTGRSSSSGRVAAQPAQFLTKTFDLVDDEATGAVISWNAQGDGFVVWDTQALCQGLLPRYFGHANLASFIRQLNTYGFRKINPERWEFANSEFLRGRRHLLGRIHRKKSANAGAPHYRHSQPQYIVGSASVDASVQYGIKEELDLLKTQACILRQQLQQANGQCQAMWQRLQMLESCGKHMLRFTIKARQDPSFLARLAQQSAAAESMEMAKQQPPRIQTMGVDTAEICNAIQQLQTCSEQSTETRPALLPPYPLSSQLSEEYTANAASTVVAKCSSQDGNSCAGSKYYSTKGCSSSNHQGQESQHHLFRNISCCSVCGMYLESSDEFCTCLSSKVWEHFQSTT